MKIQKSPSSIPYLKTKTLMVLIVKFKCLCNDTVVSTVALMILKHTAVRM